jgi:hypothetical protein
MELEGAWLDGAHSKQGAIWAWGEWEPEAEVIRSLNPITAEHPHFLWKPYWVRKQSYKECHNTDPFIFDGFYYTDCKQARSPALEGLRCLDAGSIIAFGSAKRPNWVLDAVLVVSEWIDHDEDTYRARLSGRVPECYWDVTLAPTYEGAWRQRRRLYIGATHEKQFEQMFSFFPCCPVGKDTGFARPAIKLPSDYFNVGLLQGARGHRLDSATLPITTLQGLWRSLTEQVLAQGLWLGIAAASPELRDPPGPQPPNC